MIKKCKVCGSFAINHHLHGRDGSDDELCDVCFWVKRAKSHDELVQMNQELLAALEALFHETNQHNLSVADKVIAKAKGGAA